jgi:hypothetical protein
LPPGYFDNNDLFPRFEWEHYGINYKRATGHH